MSSACTRRGIAMILTFLGRAMCNASNQGTWTTIDTTARFDATGAQINQQFGQVTAAANPRIVPLGLRVVFSSSFGKGTAYA